jgi:hypothetical protein
VADLSDVTAYLAQAAASAVYPNGNSQPSVVSPMAVRIFEGWPVPDQLDLDLAGKMLSGSPPVPAPRSGGPLANVSIFPMAGTGIGVYQIQDKTYTIVPPSYGMALVQAGNTITVSGQPGLGEYISLIADGNVILSQTGTTTALLLAALAAQAQTSGYPSASSTATTLTVPSGHSLVVRQGAVATLGEVTHRQKHSVMITVWAPTHAARNTLAAAIDVLIKQTNRVTLPDTSQALVIFSRTNVSDEGESSTIYRRDLIYDVEYATLKQFPGYVVTSVTTAITSAVGNAVANAVT